MNQNIKDPGLAAVFSFIFNGLGHLYNGQIFKGLVIISISALVLLILLISATFIGLWLMNKIIFPEQIIIGGVLFFVSLISMCVLGIYSILDAYRVASKK